MRFEFLKFRVIDRVDSVNPNPATIVSFSLVSATVPSPLMSFMRAVGASSLHDNHFSATSSNLTATECLSGRSSPDLQKPE